MTRQVVHSACAFAEFVTLRNVEGVSHEESLRPDSAGKTIYWLVGHITATRCQMLRFLGSEPAWTPDEIARFGRGSLPAEAAAGGPRFEKLVADYGGTQERILARIGAMTDDDFAKSGSPKGIGGESTGEQLTAFMLHECYHAGQIGILRRAFGKEGAIR